MLDTWFSSALWPFSTLGWPDDTEDLRTFYPTSLLISGYDILFFWDARMIMMGLHLTGGAEPKDRIPFRRSICIRWCAPEGAKMSKTKGTGVDPLELTRNTAPTRCASCSPAWPRPAPTSPSSEDRILGYARLRQQDLECRAIPLRQSREGRGQRR